MTLIGDRADEQWLRRALSMLVMCFRAAAMARTGQRRLELGLDRRQAKLAYPVTEASFNRIKRVVEKIPPPAQLPTVGPPTSC